MLLIVVVFQSSTTATNEMGLGQSNGPFFPIAQVDVWMCFPWREDQYGPILQMRHEVFRQYRSMLRRSSLGAEQISRKLLLGPVVLSLCLLFFSRHLYFVCAQHEHAATKHNLIFISS